MSDRSKRIWRISGGVFSALMLVGTGYLLLVEHQHHIYQWLPILVLLVCPLMHVLTHGGPASHR
jgi:hypothetical protein